MKGKLYVIDGLDGSGKSTQAQRVLDRLVQKGINARLVSFPCYDSKSSALVKMYLEGTFGKRPDDVSPYAASSFYAVDRYSSYKTDWGKDYESGTMIVAARYTTSNIIHQTEKLPRDKWEEFIVWTQDYEYNLLGLPRPDKVIFLDMPVDVSERLLSHRYNGDENKKDIHEGNTTYLNACRRTASVAARLLSWTVIDASDGVSPLDMETITKKILDEIDC